MLRPVLEPRRLDQDEPRQAAWRISAGSAAVLGLGSAPMNAAPTTAYVMLGGRCTGDCAFCAQARSSTASEDALSRVNWPQVPADESVKAISDTARQGTIKRVCFQVTASRDDQSRAREAINSLAQAGDIPICVSIAARSIEEISMLLGAGAERVTLAQDAASPRLFEQTKQGSWDQRWRLLSTAARLYPGHIGTHLIVGLGETEEELLYTAQALHRLGVTIGLFAFTPIRGTRLAHQPQPSLAHYRRIQAGLWLMREALGMVEDWRFDASGRLKDYGMTDQALAGLLSDGQAFQTAGCPDCNRPYYNERPSGPLYNYPRPLSPQEAEQEIALLIQSLDQ